MKEILLKEEGFLKKTEEMENQVLERESQYLKIKRTKEKFVIRNLIFILEMSCLESIIHW
jgi:sulfur relay (sulfurtransferase) DsrC/TusE family protein